MSKKINIFMALLLMALVSITGIGKVDATRIYHSNGACSYHLSFPTSYLLNNVTPQNDINRFTALAANGHVVYCYEHGIQALNHQNSDGSIAGPSYVTYTPNLGSSYVDRALAYGYSGADSSETPSCSTDRAATQLMVWFGAKADESGASYINNLTQANLVSMTDSTIGSKAYAIKQMMVNHKIIPSFAKATEASAASAEDRMELKYSETNRNFSNSQTDSKGVLSSWTKGTDPTGITSSVSGNTLTITSKNDNVTTPLKFSKTFKTITTAYIRSGQSYSGTRVQGTKYVESKNESMDAYVGYKYEKIGKGTVKIHKIDKYTGKNMKDTTFGIYSDDTCTKKAVDYLGNELSAKKSDKNGMIEWNNLYYPLKLGESRTYYVKEVDPILEGYALDSDQMEKLGAKNNCIPVKVTADYKDTSATPEKKSNKNTKAKTTTLETKEETEKAKQVLAEATKEIEDKEVVVQAVYNIPYGNVTILKTDAETKKVIPGVEFQLLKNNPKKEPAVDIHGNVVKNVKTDERGIAEFVDIPYGDYILVEVKADSWYKILEEPYEFTLNKDNDALKYKSQGTNAVPEKDEIMIENEKYRLGDPTNDGKIDAEDIKVIEDIIAKKIEETKIQFYASDVNKDNKVDENDKALLQKYIDGDKTAIPDALKEFEYETYQKRVTISLTNKPIDMKISKVDITNEKEIKGAEIEIKNEKGETFLKYKSDGTPKDFAIPIGDYTLTETVAPKGYQTLKTEVKFRVLTDGNIKLISAKSNLYKLEKSKEKDDTDLDHLKIYNSPKKISVPNTGSVVAVSTIVGGLLLIGGGSYIIYRKYKMN